METMIITATAMFLASLVMGLTGFGFVMVGIGIMSMCVPIKTIIPFIFPYNVLIFRKLTHRKFKAVSTLVLACLGAGILARTLL